MAHIVACAGANPVVEAKPDTSTVVIKIDGATLSRSPEEAAQPCKDLAHAAMSLSRTARARRGMVPAGGIEISRGNADLDEVQA